MPGVARDAWKVSHESCLARTASHLVMVLVVSRFCLLMPEPSAMMVLWAAVALTCWLRRRRTTEAPFSHEPGSPVISCPMRLMSASA